MAPALAALLACGGAGSQNAADASPGRDGSGSDGSGSDGSGSDGPGAGGSLWSDDFEGTTGAIQDHDSSWLEIFGRLDIDAGDGAVLANPGPEDGNDDYGYRPQAATEVVITAEVLWDAVDATGVILVCPDGSVHESLYEMTIYRDRLQLLRYDGGGNPSVYETLGQTPALNLSAGRYRVSMTAVHDAGTWTISGQLVASSDPFVVLGAIAPTEDSTHGPSIGQGIGIYDNSSQASRIYSMSVNGR